MSNRRAILAASLALPLIVCPVPTIAAPACITPALASLIVGYLATETEYDRWGEEVNNPAVARQDALIEAIPHFEIDATLAGDGTRIWSTRQANGSEAFGIVSAIAAINRHRHDDSPEWQDKVRRARAFTDAHINRQRAIDQTHNAAGMDMVEAQEDEICERLESTRLAIRDFPSRSVADLRAKLKTLDQWLTQAALTDMVMADLDSIQSREA